MIAFPCLQCAKVLKVKDELAGKKGKCPSCGAPVAIPTSVTAGPRPDIELPESSTLLAMGANKAGSGFPIKVYLKKAG